MDGTLLFKRERLLPGIQKRVLISSVCSYFSQVQNNNDDDNDNDDDDDDDSHNADRSKKLTLCFGASWNKKCKKFISCYPQMLQKPLLGKFRVVTRLIFIKDEPFPASYSIILKLLKICRRRDSNHGSLVKEATILPPLAQPLPLIGTLYFFLFVLLNSINIFLNFVASLSQLQSKVIWSRYMTV